MNEIIKCLKCGHVLISGRGMSLMFGQGTSIECIKCGNKYIFGQKPDLDEEKKPILTDQNTRKSDHV